MGALRSSALTCNRHAAPIGRMDCAVQTSVRLEDAMDFDAIQSVGVVGSVASIVALWIQASELKAASSTTEVSIKRYVRVLSGSVVAFASFAFIVLQTFVEDYKVNKTADQILFDFRNKVTSADEILLLFDVGECGRVEHAFRLLQTKHAISIDTEKADVHDSDNLTVPVRIFRPRDDGK
jgi:hypothetical protein